jgi:hypothetical protein
MLQVLVLVFSRLMFNVQLRLPGDEPRRMFKITSVSENTAAVIFGVNMKQWGVSGNLHKAGRRCRVGFDEADW